MVGPTRTHLPAPTSPAINAADPAATGTADQRGAFDRVEDGRMDMGSVEGAALLPCDFDGDRQCDGTDIDLLTANIAVGPADPATFDLTGDGNVTLADRDAWLAAAGAENLPSGNPYLLGDANLDGVVDASDFNLWNNSKFTVNPAWSKGDFNADGVVDVGDFQHLESEQVHLGARPGRRTDSRKRGSSGCEASSVRDLAFEQLTTEEEESSKVGTASIGRPSFASDDVR